MIIMMVEFRIHGTGPFHIAALHGGPGAWGEIGPVAEYLSENRSIIEPFFLSPTLEGQLLELETILNLHKIKKITLIGYSWGAWLGYLFAAKHPDMVKKLILVSSGPFEHKYYLKLTKTRKSRMSHQQTLRYEEILDKLQDPTETDNDAYITELGALCKNTDQYHEESPDAKEKKIKPIHFDLDRSSHFRQALNEVIKMRKSGELRDEGKKIKCPVVAIHGDYDPHPADGVKIPLEKNIENFRFFMLEKCGHKPWTETYTKTAFYTLLTKILDSQ